MQLIFSKIRENTNKWESVRQRESFWKALREIKKAQKYKPCIIFIDEFDGIGERRNYAGSGIDKENNRIITAMLNEMDAEME
ncbi:MAG: AAA family ATPase [Lachnospiraceae bacterium]|nr:AAA family ATPase [Lachnospiraceae bacterium]